jgi:hypothetical protein
VLLPHKEYKKQGEKGTRILWDVLDMSATLIVEMVLPGLACV